MLYYSLSFSIHIVKYYLFLISHFCYYWFLRFPLPRLITPQTTFDCRVPMPTIREATPTANTNENLDRTTSYHTPTAVAIPMPQTAPRTNRRRRCRVSLSSWYTPITNTVTIVMWAEAVCGGVLNWRCSCCYFRDGFAMLQEHGCWVDTLLVRWFEGWRGRSMTR